MEKEKKILIIKTAIKRFIRHGKHKTTLDEIARDLRMSKSSLTTISHLKMLYTTNH